METTLRRDGKGKDFAEHYRTDHACDSKQAGQRALKLALLRSSHATAHQRLHRRPGESPKRDQRASNQEKRGGVCAGKHAKSNDAEEQPGEKRADLPKTPGGHADQDSGDD